MDIINTGQVMLAKARIENKIREMRRLCDVAEANIIMANVHELNAASEYLHHASIELLEFTEDYAKSINPSWVRR